MLTVTPEASRAIRNLAEQSPLDDDAGLRISVGPSDGDGAQLALALAEEPEPADQVVAGDSAQVFLDEPVAVFLDDKTLDAEIQPDGVAFAIRD